MRIGVTGSSGFVGSAFCRYLTSAGDTPVEVKRGVTLPACDVLVHIGGLAHREAPLSEFMAANCEATLELASAAKQIGVSRFVFVSSINVVAGHLQRPLTTAMDYKPLSDYGVSKATAEQALQEMKHLDVAIVRPPLVFGPGAKGNFSSLMKICASGTPLPFASVNNRRSMVGVTNLCSAFHFLCRAKLSGQVFHIKDGDYSLSGIVSNCRRAMGMSPHLFTMPPSFLRASLNILGKKRMAEQLLEDLVIDDSSLREAGWQPTATEDMERMAREAMS